MIAPESTTVPARSKRTVPKRMRRSYRRPPVVSRGGRAVRFSLPGRPAYTLGWRVVPAVRGVPAAARRSRRRRPRDAGERCLLHVVHARRAGDRARGLRRGAAGERDPPACAAQRETPRSRPVVRAAGRDPRRRRAARPKPPAGTARLPPVRSRAERRRLSPRQLRSPRATAADPRRLRYSNLPLLTRDGRRDRRRRRPPPLAPR